MNNVQFEEDFDISEKPKTTISPWSPVDVGNAKSESKLASFLMKNFGVKNINQANNIILLFIIIVFVFALYFYISEFYMNNSAPDGFGGDFVNILKIQPPLWPDGTPLFQK